MMFAPIQMFSFFEKLTALASITYSDFYEYSNHCKINLRGPQSDKASFSVTSASGCDTEILSIIEIKASLYASKVTTFSDEHL